MSIPIQDLNCNNVQHLSTLLIRFMNYHLETENLSLSHLSDLRMYVKVNNDIPAKALISCTSMSNV